MNHLSAETASTVYKDAVKAAGLNLDQVNMASRLATSCCAVVRGKGFNDKKVLVVRHKANVS